MSYALVIGEKGSRKSLVIREVVQGLAARGLHVAGFTQRIFEEGPGRKTVEVVRVSNGETVPLARTSVDPGEAAAVCSFAFQRQAFEEARRWVELDVQGADVIVVDGMGKLELGGGGHRGTIEYALRAGPPVVLGLRDDNLVYALEALALEEPCASYGTAENAAALERFVDTVARIATRVQGRGTQMGGLPGRSTTSTSTP